MVTLKMKFNTSLTEIVKYLSTTNLLLCKVGYLELYEGEELLNRNNIEFYLGQDEVTDEESLKAHILKLFKYDNLDIDFSHESKTTFFELLPKIIELSKTELLKLFKILEEYTRSYVYNSTRGYIKITSNNKVDLRFGYESLNNETETESSASLLLGDTSVEIIKPREKQVYKLDILRKVIGINFKKIEEVLKTILPDISLVGEHPINLNIIEANHQLYSAFERSYYQLFRRAEPIKNNSQGAQNYKVSYGSWSGPILDFINGNVGIGYKVVGDTSFTIFLYNLNSILDSADNAILDIKTQKDEILNRYPTLFTEEKINTLIKLIDFINKSIYEPLFYNNLIGLKDKCQLSSNYFTFNKKDNILTINNKEGIGDRLINRNFYYDGTLIWTDNSSTKMTSIVYGDVEENINYFYNLL